MKSVIVFITDDEQMVELYCLPVATEMHFSGLTDMNENDWP